MIEYPTLKLFKCKNCKIKFYSEYDNSKCPKCRSRKDIIEEVLK